MAAHWVSELVDLSKFIMRAIIWYTRLVLLVIVTILLLESNQILKFILKDCVSVGTQTGMHAVNTLPMFHKHREYLLHTFQLAYQNQHIALIWIWVFDYPSTKLLSLLLVGLALYRV
jgi:hypothetical protein